MSLQVLETLRHQRNQIQNNSHMDGPFLQLFNDLMRFAEQITLREKCSNTELFLVRIQSEYRKIRTRNNSLFGHFSRIDCFLFDKDLHHERVKKDFVATVVRMWLISILQETFSSFNNSFTFSSYGARTLK